LKKLDTFNKRHFAMELVAEKVDYMRREDVFKKQKARSLLLRQEALGERKKRLVKLKDWIFDNRDRIKKAIYQDFRKPLLEVDATGPNERHISRTIAALEITSHLIHAERPNAFASPEHTARKRMSAEKRRAAFVINAERRLIGCGAAVTVGHCAQRRHQFIDLAVGGQAIGRAMHKDGDGWRYFELPTTSFAGQTADVTADISSSGGDRTYCFEVTTR